MPTQPSLLFLAPISSPTRMIGASGGEQEIELLSPSSANTASSDPVSDATTLVDDRLSSLSEPVLLLDQPDVSKQPVFMNYFDLHPTGWSSDSAPYRIAVGGGRVYVTTALFRGVRMYDAVTLAYLGSFGGPSGTDCSVPGKICEPFGVAYYRGKVYVGDSVFNRVSVWNTDGTFVKELSLHQDANGAISGVSPLGAYWGIDVAWGEIWVTTRGYVGYGSTSTGKILTQQIYVLDYQTGLLKDVIVHPVGTPFLSASYSAGNNVETVGEWEDIAVVPERHAVYAGHRAIERGVLPASIPVSEPAGRCDGCSPAMGRQQGTDAPWGMRWLLMANQMGGRANSPTPDEVKIDEFSIDADAAGHPYLTKRRTWRPKQGAMGDCCLGLDVAYLNREVRVDAWGPMSKNTWINGTQSINYVVSDADIFVVGDRGERWYEQARNFSRIELKIDGVLRASSTSASGAFSFNTNTLSSGTHTLTLTAYLLDGRTASYTNPNLRIDHDAPSGSVNALASYVSGTVAVEGTMSDAHSGGRDWQLEVQRIGGSWQTACTDTTVDPVVNRWSCNWNTIGYADGRYNVRAKQRDTVDSQTTNTSYTAPVQTVVDNTDPTLSVSGGLRDRATAALPIFEDERPPIVASSTDTGGSGVARIEVFVDGLKVDGAEQACEGCSLNPTFSFDPLRHETGDHTVRVVATDQAGRSRETSWTTEIWRNPPDAADESDADQLDPDGADTAGASSASATPTLGVIPGAANVPGPDVMQTQEGSAIGEVPDVECDTDDPYVVRDHLDYPAPENFDLMLGASNPDIAVAGYLVSAANLPRIPPGIFKEEITTDLERFYSVHIDGDRRAWMLLGRTETGGWRGDYFSACSEFIDGYFWASSLTTGVLP